MLRTRYFWTCSAGNPEDPNTWGSLCVSKGGPGLGSQGQEHCMNRCAQGQTCQNNDCQVGDCMCVNANSGTIQIVYPILMPIWTCQGVSCTIDQWCSMNALHSTGNTAFVSS